MTTIRTICTCPNVNEPVDHGKHCELWGDDKFTDGSAIWSREFWRLVSFMEWASEHRGLTIFQLADAWPNRARLLGDAQHDPDEDAFGERTVGEVLDDIEHQKLLDNNLVEELSGEATEKRSPEPCPGCKASNLQCAECGYMAEDCECVGGPDTFYCPACAHIFELVAKDAKEETEEKVMTAKAAKAEDQKSSDEVNPDSPVEIKCWCKEPKQFACVPCGVQRANKTDDWHYVTKYDAWCSCKPQKGNYCWSCGVEKKKNCDDKMVWFFLQTAWEVRNNEQVRKYQSFNATGSGYGSWGSTTTFSKCRHYEEPITFPDGTTIWASSNFTRDLEKGDVPPDFGLYCASSWQPASLAYLVAWPDFGIPKYEKAAVDAIKSVFEMAKAGKVVEVGCIGGHGRTGTALACLAILGGVKPKQAVKYVRKNYCGHAVEGDKQKWWVLHFADLIFGTKKAGKMPVAKSTSSAKAHTEEQHYDMYEAGKECQEGGWNSKEKKKDPCQYWAPDIKKFAEGYVPTTVTKSGGSGKAPTNGTSSQASSASKVGGSPKALASAARDASCVTRTSSPTAAAGETEDADAPFRSSAKCLRSNPECGALMPWGVEKCPKCGLYYAEAFWTWHLKKNKQKAKDAQSNEVWNKQLEKDAETWQTTPEDLASREPTQLSLPEQQFPPVGTVEDDYVWTGDEYGWVPEHLSGIVMNQQAEESQPEPPKNETKREKRRRLRQERESTRLGRGKKNK